jgi:hypothetical protein
LRRALVIVLGLLAIGTVGCQTAPSHALPPLGTLSVTSEPTRPQAVHVGDPITINYTVYNDGYDVDDVGLYLSGAEWDKYKISSPNCIVHKSDSSVWCGRFKDGDTITITIVAVASRAGSSTLCARVDQKQGGWEGAFVMGVNGRAESMMSCIEQIVAAG